MWFSTRSKTFFISISVNARLHNPKGGGWPRQRFCSTLATLFIWVPHSSLRLAWVGRFAEASEILPCVRVVAPSNSIRFPPLHRLPSRSDGNCSTASLPVSPLTLSLPGCDEYTSVFLPACAHSKHEVVIARLPEMPIAL